MEHSLWDYHVMGGTEYMTPISLTLIINLILIGLVIKKLVQNKELNTKMLESIKQVGGLALALGAFGTITGFFQAFDALEKMSEVLPFQVIMGGLKVALITVIYGLIVFCFSMFIYIALKLTAKS